MGWGLNPVTGPGAEPVTLAEAKDHLGVEDTDEDARITALITAAVDRAETFTRRPFITRDADFFLDKLPANDDPIELPRPPLRKVGSIKYIDTAGVVQTLATSEYKVDLSREPGRIPLAFDKDWPSVRDEANAVTVRFTAGYATPFTVNASTDVITAVGHPFADDEIVRLQNSGGTLPAGLSTFTDYFVIAVSGDTLKLSTSKGGAAIDITDAGTGTHFLGEVPQGVRQALLLLVGHWFENREAVIVGTIASALPEAVDSLLWQHRFLTVP